MEPTESMKILDWETVNSMLVSWILTSIDPKLAGTIWLHEEAKRLWDYLEKRFCVANGPRLQQLRASIVDSKQGKSQSLEDYYTKLMNLYDKLARLKPLNGCECGKCTCNITENYAKDRAGEIFHQFLLGVCDDDYASVLSDLLSQNPLHDLDRAYQTCLQEERVRRIKKEKVEKTESHIFVVQSLNLKCSNDRLIDKTILHCSHCKKTGHDVSSCFKLHGAAAWWVEKYGNSKGWTRPT